ncbi:MAG: hypothetical protein ACP5UO_02825 [Thermoplasmata archaeon]
MAQDILGGGKIVVIRGYKIEPGNGLIVILSHDGQSRDAIPYLRSSGEKGIVLSVGGIIRKEAKENGWEYQSLPRGYPLKFLMPEVVGCILSMAGKILEPLKLGPFIESLLPSSPSSENISKQLAKQLRNGPILLVYDDSSVGLAKRFSDLLKLNARVDAVSADAENASALIAGNSNINVVSFAKDTKYGIGPPIKGFPYPSEDPYGYLKNAVIAEFSSVYLSFLLGIEIDLLDIL